MNKKKHEEKNEEENEKKERKIGRRRKLTFLKNLKERKRKKN